MSKNWTVDTRGVVLSTGLSLAVTDSGDWPRWVRGMLERADKAGEWICTRYPGRCFRIKSAVWGSRYQGIVNLLAEEENGAEFRIHSEPLGEGAYRYSETLWAEDRREEAGRAAAEWLRAGGIGDAKVSMDISGFFGEETPTDRSLREALEAGGLLMTGFVRLTGGHGAETEERVIRALSGHGARGGVCLIVTAHPTEAAPDEEDDTGVSRRFLSFTEGGI